MSTETEIPSEKLSSSPPESSTHNSSNQTSFPTHYYPYYPMSYNNMRYFPPPFLYNRTLYNSGYALPWFPYYQTMLNNMTYVPLQFPYYQPVHNYKGYSYAQPRFTSPPAYSNRAPEPQLPEPSPSSTTTPSRALILSVSTHVTEATLRHELEAFGGIRALQMERLHEGFVTVHFYDMRHAEDVLAAICQRNMQQPPAAHGVSLEQVKWAEFTQPEPSAIPDGDNQGTIVVFNLDERVSSNHLKEIFEEFGPVKELRETPHKIHQKFIEFYDVRDATRAMEQMNGKKMYDRNIIIQYGKPGGYNRNNQDGSSSFRSNRIIFPPRNLPPRLRRRRPSKTAIACKVSGRVSLWKGPPEGETGGHGGGSNCSSDQSATNLSFTGQLEYSSVTTNENVQNVSSPTRNRLRDNPRFKIDEDAIMDSRTTVMIRNIPKEFRRVKLMNMLDNFCMETNAETAVVAGEEPPSSYDYIYFPIDFKHKSNMGYAFVNMTSPKAVLKLHKAFHGQAWDIDVDYSNKICEISYARIQGIKAIKDHFKNAKFPSDFEEKMPVMFLPPRDGRTLTDPVSIFYCDSPPPPQHPVSPLYATASKEDQLDIPPAEGVEDENDDDGRTTIPYPFMTMHKLA